MDGPDATITLLADADARQGSTHTVRATLTGIDPLGVTVPVIPTNVRLVLLYEGAAPPLRRTIEQGIDRAGGAVRVHPDGSIFATFVPSLPGALHLRIEATVDVGGVSFTKAADTTLYVRRNRTAA